MQQSPHWNQSLYKFIVQRCILTIRPSLMKSLYLIQPAYIRPLMVTFSTTYLLIYGIVLCDSITFNNGDSGYVPGRVHLAWKAVKETENTGAKVLAWTRWRIHEGIWRIGCFYIDQSWYNDAARTLMTEGRKFTQIAPESRCKVFICEELEKWFLCLVTLSPPWWKRRV